MTSSLDTLIHESFALSGPRDCLSDYESRLTEAIPSGFYSHLDELRAEAVDNGDENLAKAVWCLESIGQAQDRYVEAFRLCRNDEFYQAWCALEHCENTLRFLRRHYAGGGDRFGVDHMLSHVPRFQDLFPYRVFFSPGFLVHEAKCSICDSPIKLRSGCNHRVGDIYNGRMCTRIITESEFLEIAIVENPVQKYSVALGQSYNYGVVDYVIQGLASPWHAWEYERSEVETPELLHPGTGRNEVCPCGSGMKFKRCCIDKRKTRDHFQIYFAVPPPFNLPRFLEDARHIKTDEVRSSSVEAREK